MVVSSRCFAFRALITRARIWKRCWVQNSTSLLFLPIPSSAQTCKIFTNKLWQFLFRLSWHFKREKSVFWNFLQNKNWLRVQDFVFKTLRLVRVSLLISAITKSFAFFSREIYFIKAIENVLSSCVCITSTSSRVCITVENSPNPSRVCIRLCKHGKRLLLLKWGSLFDTYKVKIATLIYNIYNRITPSCLEHLIQR